MVLSDRFTGDPNQSLLKRTALYVLVFGLGALTISAVAGFTLVSIAEGVLPEDAQVPADARLPTRVEGGTRVNVIGDEPAATDSPKRSKGRRARANEAADDPI